MKLLLLTISNCPHCIRLKNLLDNLQYSLIETPFTYQVINVEKNPEYVSKYQMTSAPLLVFPTGYVLRYVMGLSPLQDLIEKEYIIFKEKEEL